MTNRIRSITVIIGFLGIPPAVVVIMLTQPILFDARQKLSLDVSSQALRDHVIQLSEKLPRRSDDTDKLDFTVRYINHQLSQYGEVQEHVYEAGGIPYRNVSVTFGPE